MAERFRVLVIDDDPGIRDYLEAAVSRQGYEVFAAANGEDALGALHESKPDIVTLDVVLARAPAAGRRKISSTGSSGPSRC